MDQVDEVKRGLVRIADDLDRAERHGAPVDNPEGIRWVQISDTAVQQLSGLLRRLAGEKGVPA